MEKQVDKEILYMIKGFVRKVRRELGIDIDEVYLFGSRARGDYKLDSDVDLILVSRDWRGRVSERMGALYRIWCGDLDATLIPLTPEELKKKIKESITIRDAARYWIKIIP